MIWRGSYGIVAIAWCFVSAFTLADDAAGVLHVVSDTNGEATVEMPFVPFGDGTISTFLSGTFFGDGGADSDRLWRYGRHYDDKKMREAVRNLKKSGNWTKEGSGPGGYNFLKHNCQDFVAAVIREYFRIGGR